jgi:glutamine cyclotransferase
MKISYDIGSSYFGEGSTSLNGVLYMLTWKNGVVFTFDSELNALKTFDLPSEIAEGWGITHDDEFLYISDGSSSIFKIDPTDFTVVSSI